MALEPIDNITHKIQTSSATLKSTVSTENEKELKKIATPLPKVEMAADVKISQSTLHIHSSEQDINLEKIEQIKLAIKNGSLTMDTSKIADKLIAELNSPF